jgi:pectin methylesterase-like acyl-CoA thioesterase
MAAREFARLEPAVRPFLVAANPPPLHFVVAQDGSGDSKTIQYAIDHAPTQTGTQRLAIEIRPGVYHERVVVPRGRGRVTFLGKDAASTIITAGMSAKAAGGTFLRSTVDVEADGFEAENITFENTFGVGSQAVALSVHSDRAVLRNCRLLGWQDTLYAAYGRQYYKDCYIAGHVDFIFGNATAVFDDCEIHSLGAGYLTAHSRTTPEQTTGYVFRRCRLTGENTGKGGLSRPTVAPLFARRVYRLLHGRSYSAGGLGQLEQHRGERIDCLVWRVWLYRSGRPHRGASPMVAPTDCRSGGAVSTGGVFAWG